MLKFRRHIHEPRVEMTPLIDVVFLLLTFFVFSLVLMIRADVLGVKLPSLAAGMPAEREPAITIVLDRDGRYFVDGDEAPADRLVELVRSRRSERPDAKLLVAADEQGGRAELVRLFDLLAGAGLGDFGFVGRSDRPTP